MATPVVPPMDPSQMPQSPFAAFTPPQPPPATTPSMGFQAWAADPQNAQKVAPSMTAPNSPLQPNQGQQQPAAAPPPVDPTRMNADMAELTRLQQSGAGVDQIQNKPGRVLAKIADTIGSIVAPGISAAIPGTTMHNRLLQQHASQRVQTDQDQLTALLNNQKTEQEIQQAPEELDIKRQGAALKSLAAKGTFSKNGLKVVDDGQGNTNVVPDEDSPVYQKQQAQTEYFESRKSAEDALAALDQARTAGMDPNSPQFKLLQQKVNAEIQRTQVAGQRVGLSRDQFNMHAYNTGPDGQVLPGALIGDDGQAVGTANAANVRPTATQRDAAGRADVADSLRTNILAQLKDPEVRNAFGPLNGRLTEAQIKLGTASPKVAKAYNDLVSYGAFQAGMHPVRGIGALEYFDKVNGGMAQTPEQLEGKLASGQGVMKDVTAIGTPNVKGGRQQPSIPARNASANPPKVSFKQTASGPGGQIGSNDGGKTWFDVKTGKKVQ